MAWHAINKETFEFTCESEAMARKLQQEIDVYFAPQLNAVIEHVLSQHAGDDERIVVDTIEIDLGKMKLEDLGKDEILKKFSEALEEKLQSIHAPDAQPRRNNNGHTHARRTQWEMISSMVEHGDLPWWADKNQADDIDLLLHRLFRQDRHMARSFLEQQRRNTPALFRLASQYRPSTRKLIDELMPGVLPAFLRTHLFGTVAEHATLPTLSPDQLSAVAALLDRDPLPGAGTDRAALLDKLVRSGAMGWLESRAFIRELSEEDRNILRTFISMGARAGRALKQQAIRSLEKLTVFQASFLAHYLSGVSHKEGNERAPWADDTRSPELYTGMSVPDAPYGLQEGRTHGQLSMGVIPEPPGAIKHIKTALQESGGHLPAAEAWRYARADEGTGPATLTEDGNGHAAAGAQEASAPDLYPDGTLNHAEWAVMLTHAQDTGWNNKLDPAQQTARKAVGGASPQVTAAGDRQSPAESISPDSPASNGANDMRNGIVASGAAIDPGVTRSRSTTSDMPRPGGETTGGVPTPDGEPVNTVSPPDGAAFNSVFPVRVETTNGSVRDNPATIKEWVEDKTKAIRPLPRGDHDLSFPAEGARMPAWEPADDEATQDAPAAATGAGHDETGAAAAAQADARPDGRPAPLERLPVAGQTRAGDAGAGKIGFIMKQLGNNDPAMLRYLLQLPRKDIDRLHAMFSKSFRQAAADKKRISHLLDHPYFLRYNLLNLYVNLSFGNTSNAPTDQLTSQGKRKTGKAGLLAEVANKIRFAQSAFLAMVEALSQMETLVIRDVLKKQQFDTSSERKIVRKLLHKVPAESLRVLDYLTSLPEEEILPLVASVQGGRAVAQGGLPFSPVAPATPEKSYIENAGLCLVALYLPGLFSNLGYIENRVFKNKAYALKALCVTQYLATGNPKTREFLLQLNKLLTGFELEEPIPAAVRLTKKEMAETDSLIESVIANWKALKNTSVEGFRTAFLQRKGILFEKGGCWTLQVEKKGHDVLLNNIPWGFGMIKLPWMKKMIQVEW